MIYHPNELKSCFDLSLFNYLFKCRRTRLIYFEKWKLYQGHSISLLGKLSYHPIRNHNLFSLASVQVYISHGMGEIHGFPQRNRVPLSVFIQIPWFMNKMIFRYVRFLALHKKLSEINALEWHHFSWKSSVNTTSKQIHNWGGEVTLYFQAYFCFILRILGCRSLKSLLA